MSPPEIAWTMRVLAESTRTSVVPRAVRSCIYEVYVAPLFALLLNGHSRPDRVLASFATDPDGERFLYLSWDDGFAVIRGYFPGDNRPVWEVDATGTPVKNAPKRYRRREDKTGPVGTVSISFFSEPQGTTLDVLRLVCAHLTPPRKKLRLPHRTREVGVISAGMEGLRIVSHTLPDSRYKLQKDNYPPEVMDQFGRLAAFCKGKVSADAGALVLIDGPPGTGKTHLIRALIRSVAAPYVMAAGSTIANLENPGFIPFILEACRERNGLVLILEDADSVIIKRELLQNVGVLSLLLNATSGILGDLTKLRVIATVNTWQDDRVDQAVLRAGRLFSRIQVGALSVEQARKVVLRETAGNELAAARVVEPMSLADCYALARRMGA